MCLVPGKPWVQNKFSYISFASFSNIFCILPQLKKKNYTWTPTVYCILYQLLEGMHKTDCVIVHRNFHCKKHKDRTMETDMKRCGCIHEISKWESWLDLVLNEQKCEDRQKRGYCKGRPQGWYIKPVVGWRHFSIIFLIISFFLLNALFPQMNWKLLKCTDHCVKLFKSTKILCMWNRHSIKA